MKSNLTIKKYRFFYLDRSANELMPNDVQTAYSIQQAKAIANDYLANSMQNDLFRIKVKRIY